MKNIRIFIWKFSFLVEIFSVYLNMLVFVMIGFLDFKNRMAMLGRFLLFYIHLKACANDCRLSLYFSN